MQLDEATYKGLMEKVEAVRREIAKVIVGQQDGSATHEVLFTKTTGIDLVWPSNSSVPKQIL